MVGADKLPLEYAISTRALGHTRCRPEDAEDGCVELELHAKVRPSLHEATRAMARSMLPAIGETDELPPDAQIEVQTEVRLVAEPETLRPHRLEWRVTGALTHTEHDRQSRQIMETSRCYTYHYER